MTLDSNNLSTLNIQNGNNTAIIFSTIGNPLLTCIQVDDTAWAATNWTDVDATSYFSTNCITGINEKAVVNFDVSVYPNPVNNYFNIAITEEKINKNLFLQILDVAGKVVQQQAVFNGLNDVNISNLPEGYYTLLISSESTLLASQKLIISQ